MLSSIKNILTYFQNTGIEDSYTMKEKIRIRTSNELILMGFFIVLLREVFNILFFSSVGSHLTVFMWLGIYFSAHMLTKKKQHKIARVIIMTTIFLFTMGLQYNAGHNNLVAEPIYALLIYFTILFYDKGVQKIVIPTICIAYVGLVIISDMSPVAPVSGAAKSAQLLHVVSLFAFFFYIARRNVSYSINNREILKEQQEELESKNVQLGKFNNIIAHDLKEPIRSIVSFGNLLTRAKGNKERRQDYANYVVRSGHQLNHLVFGIKEFHELTDMQLVYAPVNLNELVDRAKSSLTVDMQDRKVNIDAANLPNIYSTKPPLQAVFENLIQNGIRFNNKEEVNIKIWSEEKNDKVYVYFKDNGMGIESQYHEAVFEMFKRLGTDDTKSPGLGLNLCKRVVERLGGTLTIQESIMEKGTTFCMVLPSDEESKRLMKERVEADAKAY